MRFLLFKYIVFPLFPPWTSTSSQSFIFWELLVNNNCHLFLDSLELYHFVLLLSLTTSGICMIWLPPFALVYLDAVVSFVMGSLDSTRPMSSPLPMTLWFHSFNQAPFQAMTTNHRFVLYIPLFKFAAMILNVDNIHTCCIFFFCSHRRSN